MITVSQTIGTPRSQTSPLKRFTRYFLGGLALVVLLGICIGVGLAIDKRNKHEITNSGMGRQPSDEGFQTTSSDSENGPEGSLFYTVSVNTVISSTSMNPISSEIISPESTPVISEEEEQLPATSFSFLNSLYGNMANMQGGEEGPSTSLDQAIYSAGLRNSTFMCFPQNGDEVLQAVNSANCRVIILTETSDNIYDIKTELQIVGRKIIMGHPVRRPVLKPAKGVERLFHGKDVYILVLKGVFDY